MVLLLSRILPLLILPVGLTLILLSVGLVLRRRGPMVAALVVLWLSSTPVVGAQLNRAMERWRTRIPVSAAVTADAIVVLSSGRVVAPGPARVSEWGDADRFFAGVELAQAGKAPLLVFTGGWAPWEPDAPLEGEILARQAITMGLPESQVMTTGRVGNTAEEAAAVRALLQSRPGAVNRILLVTSAYHMSRAQSLFERAGFTVSPFAVDFRNSSGPFSVLHLVPNAGALVATQTALREAYGQLLYRLLL